VCALQTFGSKMSCQKTFAHLLSAVTERLRSLGYPAPRYCFVGNIAGASYSIQEALPGVPLGRCTPELLPRLLDLNTLQVGQALSMPRNWPAPVVQTVLHGGDGFCLLETMRAYSSTTSELLDVLQRVVTTYADTPIATDDIVHIDFNPANILVDDGQISGVVDWEDAHAGDCTFDLATLLFYSYDIAALREPLQRLALDRAGINALDDASSRPIIMARRRICAAVARPHEGFTFGWGEAFRRRHVAGSRHGIVLARRRQWRAQQQRVRARRASAVFPGGAEQRYVVSAAQCCIAAVRAWAIG
jgi:hypothetical protein